MLLVFLDGERWLVAPYGEREWVKNARAAGAVELTRARRTERVRVEEVDAQTAAPVLREYLRKTPVTKPFFTAKRSASLAKPSWPRRIAIRCSESLTDVRGGPKAAPLDSPRCAGPRPRAAVRGSAG